MGPLLLHPQPAALLPGQSSPRHPARPFLEGSDQSLQRHAQDLAEVSQLHEVKAALPRLDVAHERLWRTQLSAHLHLRESASLAEFAEQCHECSMFRTMKTLAHGRRSGTAARYIPFADI